MPATVRLPPGGAVDDAGGFGAKVMVRLGGAVRGVVLGDVLGAVVVRELLGGVESATEPPRENWWAVKAAMPPTRASTPTTSTAPKIHHARLPDGRGGTPGYGAP